MRVKVACINWGQPSAPRAVSYVMRGDTMIAERYHATWAEAMFRADFLSRILAVTA